MVVSPPSPSPLPLPPPRLLCLTLAPKNPLSDGQAGGITLGYVYMKKKITDPRRGTTPNN